MWSLKKVEKKLTNKFVIFWCLKHEKDFNLGIKMDKRTGLLTVSTFPHTGSAVMICDTMCCRVYMNSWRDRL